MGASAASVFVGHMPDWRPGDREPAPPTLTPHETRVVLMLADGRSYQEIADRFGVTVNTVRNYIRSAYVKLDVHTRAEAVSKALRGRLIT